MAPLDLSASIPPHLVPSRNTAVILLVAAAATSVPVAYLVSIRRSCLKRAHVCPGRPPALPTSLPKDVLAYISPPDPDLKSEGDQDEEAVAVPPAFVLSHERLVSVPVAVSSLRPELQVEEEGLDVVLTPYVRATMTAWLGTAAGKAARRAVEAMVARAVGGKQQQEDPEATTEETALALLEKFSADKVNSLDFEVGDVAAGIYRVAHRGESADGGERVELAIEMPWLGSRGKDDSTGIITVAGWEVLEPASAGAGAGAGVGKEKESEEQDEGVNLVFVNETWMWRRKGQWPATLEWSLGRWWHAALAGWLVDRGIDAVTAPPVAEELGEEGGEVNEKDRPAADEKVAGAKPRSTSKTGDAKEDESGEALKEDTETETETETSASEASDDDE